MPSCQNSLYRSDRTVWPRPCRTLCILTPRLWRLPPPCSSLVGRTRGVLLSIQGFYCVYHILNPFFALVNRIFTFFKVFARRASGGCTAFVRHIKHYCNTGANFIALNVSPPFPAIQQYSIMSVITKSCVLTFGSVPHTVFRVIMPLFFVRPCACRAQTLRRLP